MTLSLRTSGRSSFSQSLFPVVNLIGSRDHQFSAQRLRTPQITHVPDMKQVEVAVRQRDALVLSIYRSHAEDVPAVPTIRLCLVPDHPLRVIPEEDAAVVPRIRSRHRNCQWGFDAPDPVGVEILVLMRFSPGRPFSPGRDI